MKTKLIPSVLAALCLTTSLTAVGQFQGQSPTSNERPSNSQQLKAASAVQKSSKGMKLSEDSNQKPAAMTGLKSLEEDRQNRSEKMESLQKMNEGGVNDGGGSHVFVDGQWILSDSFYEQLGGLPLRFEQAFPKEVQEYIERAHRVLRNYGIRHDGFWSEVIKGPRALYVFVTETEFAKVRCDHYLPQLDREVDAHEQFGCKSGNTTYLITSKFAKKNILEQARSIIHERLWVLQPQIDQRFIAYFTTSLGMMMKKLDDQVLRKDRSWLTAAELKQFSALEISAVQLGFLTGNFEIDTSLQAGYLDQAAPLASRVSQQGGGLLLGATEIDRSSFVGIGSLFFGDFGNTIKNSVLINSKIASADIENSYVLDSNVASVTMKDSQVLASSLIGSDWSDAELIQENASPKERSRVTKVLFAKISRSSLSEVDVFGTFQDATVVTDSELSGQIICGSPSISGCKKWFASRIGHGANIQNSKIKTAFEIQGGANLEKMDLDMYTYGHLKVAAGSVLKNLKCKKNKEENWIWETKPKMKFDASGRVLDFGGRTCSSKKFVFDIHEVADALN